MIWWNLKVDKMWRKRNFIQRIAAKIVAKMLLEEYTSWQCSGKKNWDLNNGIKADIQVPVIQLAQIVLRESGYNVCVADIERYRNGGKEVLEEKS